MIHAILLPPKDDQAEAIRVEFRSDDGQIKQAVEIGESKTDWSITIRVEGH